MLNIVHVHINDTSDTVTVNVAYMLEGHSVKDFTTTFEKDISGQDLRYKILVRD